MAAIVALLTEGVDRNGDQDDNAAEDTVALLTEGVDRNQNDPCKVLTDEGRPPHGGRG